jgi:hypothetical protein
MLREHRRFLIVEEIVGSILVNFPLNAAIAWFLFRSAAQVPLWGWTSIAADTVVTAFMLPFLTALFATRAARARVVSGKLPCLPRVAMFAWLPQSSAQRGALVGAASIALAAAPVVGAFVLVGPPTLSLWTFIWFKAIFATILGVLVTPLFGWWGLCDVGQPTSETTVRNPLDPNLG